MRVNVGRVLVLNNRVTRYDPISIWKIGMGHRYGMSDFNEISIGIAICKMGHRCGI